MKKHKRKIQTGIVIGLFSVIIIACLIYPMKMRSKILQMRLAVLVYEREKMCLRDRPNIISVQRRKNIHLKTTAFQLE